MELECQLLVITSPCYIQHLNASVCACHTLNLPTVCWDPLTSLPSNEAPADDTHVKWRQMVDESLPLTLVIRYGRSNWLAVFPINRHYGPLCQPSPLAALLFLEAPGSSRAPVLLSPPCRSTLLLYQQHHSISGLIQQIGSNRGSLIDILAHFFLMSAFAQKIIIYSWSHIWPDQFSAQSTILFTDFPRLPYTLCPCMQYTIFMWC